MSLSEMPGAKALSRALLFRAILRVMGALKMSVPHDCLNNSCDQLSHTSSFLPRPSQVNQVVIAAITIFSNTRRFWTMYLCNDSIKFVLEAPDS